MATIMIRTSERQSFLTCRAKWNWAWNEKLRVPEADTKLVFGDLVHQALAAYYKKGRKRGPKPSVTFELLCKKHEETQTMGMWGDDGYEDFVHLGVVMLERYVEHWKEQDHEYEIISSEQIFQVPIGKIDGYRIVYVGTIDGVWRHLPTQKIRFAEHKTAASITQDALPMDEQVGAYWTYGPRWLLLHGILKSGERLDGVLYNWLRKAIPSPDSLYDRFGRSLNKDGTVSKRQPPPYFERKLTFRGDTEASRVKERVKQQVKDMIAARSDPAQIYKNPGPQFLSNCKFCSFKDGCELHETGNDWEAFFKAAYVKWDPYEAHERVERR